MADVHDPHAPRHPGENDCALVAAEDGQQLSNGDWGCDVDDDGNYRDVNADGDVTRQAPSDFFQRQHRDPWGSRDDLFDFDEDGTARQPDVVALFESI